MSTATKIMGFFPKLVWVMGYYRFMGLGYEITANQLGGLKILWVFAGYGLSQVWVKTGSTVLHDRLLDVSSIMLLTVCYLMFQFLQYITLSFVTV